MSYSLHKVRHFKKKKNFFKVKSIKSNALNYSGTNQGKLSLTEKKISQMYFTKSLR
jgi:hypothetical protein